jgi:bifunctional enzyme CysN/CysC
MQRVEIEQIVSRTNLDTLAPEPCETLELNDIGTVRVRCHRPIYFDAYRKNRRTGAFILIDSLSNGTVAAGMIIGPTAALDKDRRPGDDRRFGQHSLVSPREREERLGQRGAVVLLTGLPGSGKTELAYAVERLLYDRSRVALVVDPADSISRESPEVTAQPGALPASVLEVARRAADAGLVVVLAFAAAERGSRKVFRTGVGAERCIEVLVSGARRAPENVRYEAPDSPDLHVDLEKQTSEAGAQTIVDCLEERGLIG